MESSEDLPGQRPKPSPVTDGTDVEGLTSHLTWDHRSKFISAYQPFLTQTHIHRPESLEHRPFMSELMGVSQQPICENSSSPHTGHQRSWYGRARCLQATTWPHSGREPGALRPSLGTQYRSPCMHRAVGRPASSCWRLDRVVTNTAALL